MDAGIAIHYCSTSILITKTAKRRIFLSTFPKSCISALLSKLHLKWSRSNNFYPAGKFLTATTTEVHWQ
jgi:hypothetical protein